MNELGTSASIDIVSIRPMEGDPKGAIVTFSYKYPKSEFMPFNKEQAQGILQFTKAKPRKK